MLVRDIAFLDCKYGKGMAGQLPRTSSAVTLCEACVLALGGEVQTLPAFLLKTPCLF